LPFVLKLANQGWHQACANDRALHKGLNIVEGKVVYKEINEAFSWNEPILA